jgi:hypothetical protein
MKSIIRKIELTKFFKMVACRHEIERSTTRSTYLANSKGNIKKIKSLKAREAQAPKAREAQAPNQ